MHTPQSGLQSLASIQGMHFLAVQTYIKHLPAADVDLRLYPGSAHVPALSLSKLVFNCQ